MSRRNHGQAQHGIRRPGKGISADDEDSYSDEERGLSLRWSDDNPEGVRRRRYTVEVPSINSNANHISLLQHSSALDSADRDAEWVQSRPTDTMSGRVSLNIQDPARRTLSVPSPSVNVHPLAGLSSAQLERVVRPTAEYLMSDQTRNAGIEEIFQRLPSSSRGEIIKNVAHLIRSDYCSIYERMSSEEKTAFRQKSLRLQQATSQNTVDQQLPSRPVPTRSAGEFRARPEVRFAVTNQELTSAERERGLSRSARKRRDDEPTDLAWNNDQPEMSKLKSAISSSAGKLAIKHFSKESMVPYKAVPKSRSAQLKSAGSSSEEDWNLGTGRHSKVDVVRLRDDRSSGVRFARKEILRDGKTQADGSKKPPKIFEEEVFMNRKLDEDNPTAHRVKLHDAYDVAGERFFLILTPAAMDGNLYQKLMGFAHDESREHRDDDVVMLQQATGCLTVAVASMHVGGFRHRDLHPKNVLFHEKQTLLCDFGVSLHFTRDLSGTTTTKVPPRMERYAAPEVISTQGKHNYKTDVFSLGAMLFEIQLAIDDPDKLRELFDDNGWRYEARIQQTQEMCNSDKFEDASLMQLIKSMIAYEKEKRPTAVDASMKMRELSQPMCSACEARVSRFTSKETLKDFKVNENECELAIRRK